MQETNVLVASALLTPRGQPITRVVGACKVVKREKVVTLDCTLPLVGVGSLCPHT